MTKKEIYEQVHKETIMYSINLEGYLDGASIKLYRFYSDGLLDEEEKWGEWQIEKFTLYDGNETEVSFEDLTENDIKTIAEVFKRANKIRR